LETYPWNSEQKRRWFLLDRHLPPHVSEDAVQAHRYINWISSGLG
jgi:hypothetical protein